jgi:hypothetical protein
MYIAEVVAPEEKLEFECELCKLKYDCADYHILLTAKKLAYFSLGDVDDVELNEIPPSDIIIEIMCHGCLYKVLKDEAGTGTLKFKLVHKDMAYWSTIDGLQEDGGFLLD